MAKNDFFLQGIVADTFIDAVRWVLKVPKLKKIIIGTAFVNEEGVRNLEKDLTPLANKVSVFAGIRNDITSKQGLARLLKIKTSVFVVDTGSRGIIFHPKLYLAKGENNTRLVIGSGNFTPGGLNNNIEGGLMLDLDMNERSDKKLVSNIEAQFKQLLDRFPENVSLIQKSSELDLLLKTGRLLDEASQADIYGEDNENGYGSSNKTCNSVSTSDYKACEIQTRNTSSKTIKKFTLIPSVY